MVFGFGTFWYLGIGTKWYGIGMKWYGIWYELVTVQRGQE